tara:strand:- start:89 stop:190 length:102 start_codon:yes stop_codon:yes gene_type:complete
MPAREELDRQQLALAVIRVGSEATGRTHSRDIL